MPIRENLRFLPIRLSDKVRHCVEEKEHMSFKEDILKSGSKFGICIKNFTVPSNRTLQRWQQLDQECEKLHDHYKNTPQQKFVENYCCQWLAS